MRPVKKGESQIGMNAFYKTTKGVFIPMQIGSVQNRGSYDFLTVREVTKSGKILKKIGTLGNYDLWLP